MFLFVYDFLVLKEFLWVDGGLIVVLECKEVGFELVNIVIILFVIDLVMMVILLIFLLWLVGFVRFLFCFIFFKFLFVCDFLVWGKFLWGNGRLWCCCIVVIKFDVVGFVKCFLLLNELLERIFLVFVGCDDLIDCESFGILLWKLFEVFVFWFGIWLGIEFILILGL